MISNSSKLRCWPPHSSRGAFSSNFGGPCGLTPVVILQICRLGALGGPNLIWSLHTCIHCMLIYFILSIAPRSLTLMQSSFPGESVGSGYTKANSRMGVVSNCPLNTW